VLEKLRHNKNPLTPSTDFVKLGVYVGFFAVLMMFYGLPIHIMRDLFLTTRSFLKRLSALVRYRKALQDMNKYADATEEDLARENTCIICREEMRPWDPSVPGAVERYRPKKLPCGHILHQGCLKGWLERQQVCPTCRRSVVIDGAPNGDGAARPNLNGQAPAPGQPGADNRGGNGGQGAQGRGGNMRMFQFGPLRLGFAQGNPENVQEMLQQRFNAAGLDAAHVPLAPAPPTPVRPTPQHTFPPSTGNVSELGSQLQNIQQRLQQEIFALQATQAELQTTYTLLAELQRLRLAQQQQTLHGQAPVQTGFPIGTQIPPLPQQPFPQPLPHMPSIAPFNPFTRINTPSVTRHAVSAYSTPIPAGSPDLPEGVVIPQGWTLMPLQRMDGTSQQPAPTASTLLQPETSQSHATTSSDGPQGPSSAEQVSLPRENGSVEIPAETPAASSSEAHPEPELPEVAAPTPVVPNWGGAAQLFANGGVSTPSASTTVAERPVVEGENTERSEQDDEGDSSDKGKAKAVTIEDAEDAEDE
jgi:E3 ubiquitin-protein ligase synoviolin